MAKIETFELDRWSEPNEKNMVKHIGMADAKETFNKLKAHLEKLGMLPDEYFLFSGERYGLTGELPNFDEAVCHANFGSNEGIYLDIILNLRDGQSNPQSIHFATGKTLDEDADAFYRMSRIAAECSLMLNGRGSSYRRENVELLLTLEDARIFASLLAPVMRDEMTVKVKRVLTAMLEQIPPVTYTTVTALMKHGEDDFSTWIFDMQDEALEQFDHARTRQTADLESLMANCPMLEGNEDKLNLLFPREDGRYSLRTCTVGAEFFEAHQHTGYSVRGSKEEIMFDLTDEVREQADEEGLEP